MITKEKALQIAAKRIGEDAMIYDEHTVEKPYGWIFFYDALPGASPLAGNCPFLIDTDGNYHGSGVTSAYSTKYHIEAFDKRFGISTD